MIYRTQKGQTSSGEAIGILLLDTAVPFVPGDVANATTYGFPVRFRTVRGFSVKKALGQDPAVYEALRTAAWDLVGQGVRAVTGDCGFMALHQQRLADELSVPVFLSSLLQLPFLLSLLGKQGKVGIITADSRSLDETLLAAIGIHREDRVVIEGLETKKHFHRFAIEESGLLDFAKVEQEVLEAGRHLTGRDPAVQAMLLECSLLPPYAASLQQQCRLPVFDYITMINYVFSAVVQRPYSGFV